MILVAGATGSLGGAITYTLLSGAKPVRILVRPNSAYQSLVEAGAQPVFGDLKDRASLEAACQGIETVITTANSVLRGGEDNTQTVDLEGNRNLIDAARSAGVKHYIFVSALGADANSPIPFMQAKGQTEQHLRNSGMDYTILAPNIFMEVWPAMVVGMPLQAGQPVTLVGEGLRKHSFISARDVVAYAVAAVDHPAARNQSIVIGGPEPLSWRDVIAIYERVLGRSIAVRRVAQGEPVPGLPGEMPSLLGMFEFFDSPIDMTETASKFGIRPTSLEEFVRNSMAAS